MSTLLFKKGIVPVLDSDWLEAVEIYSKNTNL